ncbi:MAG TPA: hypothetical protein VKV33_07480 [Streptosporangiaceae bacterium]|nr:hypothetical protein [Streptosporangiaceae bacterium]
MFRGFSRAQCAAIAITAGALAAAGCSSASHSSGGTAAKPSGGGSSLTATQAIQLAAQHAQKVTSYAATVSVRAAGTVNLSLAGTVKQRTEPSPLVVADFGNVATQGQQVAGGLQELINSDALYIKLAQLARETGKPWIKIPASQISKEGGAGFGQLLQQDNNTNPLIKTQMLASSHNVRKVGTATVDGVATTEYTGTYPLSAGLAKLPADLRAKVEPQIQSMGLKDENFTIWLDGQQQVRKVTVSDHGSKVQFTSTMQVTALNEPVSASLPPASQTATVTGGALGNS